MSYSKVMYILLGFWFIFAVTKDGLSRHKLSVTIKKKKKKKV